MDVPIYTVLIGFLVRALVGLSGLGGAVVLLPFLILGLHVPPMVAVGSSAVFMFLTKISGALVHWRRGNVDLQLALMMAVGSIPGTLAGVGTLAFLRSRDGAGAKVEREQVL